MKTPLHIPNLRHLLAAGIVLATITCLPTVAAAAPPPDTAPPAPEAAPTLLPHAPGAKGFGQARPRLTLAEVKTALTALTAPNGLTFAAYWEQRFAIIEGVNPADMPAVLAGLDQFMRRDDDLHSPPIRDSLLVRWGSIDPTAALAYANKLKNVSQRNGAQQSVFKGWAQADLPAARAWAAQLPAGILRQQVFRIIVTKLADTDPIAALDLCHEIADICNWPNDVALGFENPFARPMVTTWDTAAIFVFRKWAEKDPQAAAAKAVEILSGPARQQAFVAIADIWAETAPLAALAWAGSLTNSKTQRNILTVVFLPRRWAGVDPQAAATYVLSLPDSRMRNQAIVGIAGRWASISVTAALAWVRQLPDGPTKNQAIKGLRGGNWAPQDIPGMMAYAEALPAGTAKDEVVRIVALQLARQNPEEALRWVRRQLTGRALNSALRAMVSLLSTENPQQAAAIVASMSAGGERDSLINETASRLAEQDPAAAIAWADQLPESRALEQAWVAIGKQWATDDLQAAADYALKLPAGVRQSALVQQVAAAWGQSDPQAGLRWAQALPAGESQTRAIVKVVSSWSAVEPEAAAAWVVKCPEGELRDLLEPLLKSHSQR